MRRCETCRTASGFLIITGSGAINLFRNVEMINAAVDDNVFGLKNVKQFIHEPDPLILLVTIYLAVFWIRIAQSPTSKRGNISYHCGNK